MRLRAPEPLEPVTLLEAMSDLHLFRPWFRDMHTWAAWRCVLKSIFGLPLSRLTGESKLYQKLTGRTKAPTRPCKEAWFVIGRRGGKSFIAALIGTYLSAFRDYRAYLAPGEVATVMILSADKKQSRTIMRYARALFEEVPLLSKMVESIGLESITLKNGVVLEIHAASWRSTRGYSLAAVLADELAFWRDESSANPDVEILAALRPGMATLPNALLLCLSSPYARRGALWDAYNQHFGRDGDPVLVFQAPTELMNPTVPKEIIEQAFRDDPAAASSEYSALFRSDVDGFLQPEWIDAAIASGVHEIAPAEGITYSAFCDPAGGSGADSYTLGIAHAEGNRLVLDVCRGRRPPFDVQKVTTEYAYLLKRYGLNRVVGDRYGGDWPTQAFLQHGVVYESSQRTASEVFLESLPLFSCGAVQLLDHPHLINELRQLERITGRGRDIVDHPPRGHSDLAVSACGALLHAVNRSLSAADFERGAMTVGIVEARAARDEHLEGDLGLVELGDTTFDDSPFNKRNWE